MTQSNSRNVRVHARETPRSIGIQSVERAARMLSLFTLEQPELSLTELTHRMGMSKATVHRYATTLVKTGLLRFTGTHYTLGARVIELSAPALAGLGVTKLAGPHLRRLVERTSQTGLLSVWDGTAPVVVLVEDNTGSAFRIGVARGRRLPLTSAEGMVFRAFMSPYAREAELEDVRRDGIAFYEDAPAGLAALAAPVFQGGEVVAAMALVGTTTAIGRGPDSWAAEALRATADTLSAELGRPGVVPAAR